MHNQKLPKRVFLISDEFNDIRWSPEPDPYGENNEDSLEYISAEAVQKMLKKQRQMCAEKSEKALYEWKQVTPAGTTNLVINACMSATGERER